MLLSRTFGSPEFTLLLRDTDYTLSGYSLGIHYDFDAALAAAFTERTVPDIPLRIDPTVLSARVAQFAAETEIAPTDAAITVDRSGSELFHLHADTDGAAVDTEALILALQDAVAKGLQSIHVPTETIKANITVEQVRLLTQPLASFTTSFAESPLNKTNRVFNIKKAAETIHGTVLAPGEEFNCNAVLGDRTAQNGWKEAAAIRSGMYTTEYGGGVCQVSSTLFNAVMLADLTVTERYPHSWPMRYVSIGRDATISTGGKNFRFINSYETPVTIGMDFNSTDMTLTCTIYGAPLPAGQYIRIRSEQTATLDMLPTEYVLDESLPLQTSITEREARRGKTSVTYKDYYTADGQLLRSEIAYRDTYRSIAARVMVSTDLFYADTAVP